MQNNLFFLIFNLLVTTYSLKGQAVTFGFGPTYLIDKTKVRLHQEILGKSSGNDDWLFNIKYIHFFNTNWHLYGSYTKYPIRTYYNFKNNGNESGSLGWSGSNVNRIDFGIAYDIFYKSHFILNGNFGIGFQNSNSKDVGIIGSEVPDGIKPENFELLKDIEAFAYSNTQIVPVVGLKFGYAFWGRLELFMDIQQVLGHKTIQELRMSYTYKGIEQPQAISYSDGTGRFWALGIGYRLVKPKGK
jgi:hypothetical protein